MSDVRLRIDRSAAAVGLDGAAAVLISPVQPSGEDPALDDEVAEIEATFTGATDVRVSPEVRGYRELFMELGYPEQVPAGERLVERVRTRGFPRYGSLVDAYNLVAVRHVCGIGAHDAGAIQPGDEVRVTRAAGNERIRSHGQSRERPVVAGDVVYGLAREPERPMAWLGKRDVDSADWAVGPSTARLLVVVLGNRATSREANERILEEVTDRIIRTNPTAVSVLLDVVGS